MKFADFGLAREIRSVQHTLKMLVQDIIEPQNVFYNQQIIIPL